MLPIFFSLCVTLFFWMSGWYFVAWYFRRTDIVDMVWGLSYGVIALMLYVFFSDAGLAVIPLIFVLIWSVRLVTHIIIRLTRHTEDSRYAAFRISWGKYFYLKSYFYIFLLQGFFIAIIALPLLFLFKKHISLSPQFVIGSLLWVAGFLCEYFADRQMNQFRADKNNAGKIIQSGLWKYSRHPNYFGELLMWWSMWMMSITTLASLVGILSPLLLSYLIIYVTGIPMLETALRKRDGYESYIRTTSMLIPLPPRK